MTSFLIPCLLHFFVINVCQMVTCWPITSILLTRCQERWITNRNSILGPNSTKKKRNRKRKKQSVEEFSLSLNKPVFSIAHPFICGPFSMSYWTGKWYVGRWRHPDGLQVIASICNMKFLRDHIFDSLFNSYWHCVHASSSVWAKVIPLTRTTV